MRVERFAAVGAAVVSVVALVVAGVALGVVLWPEERDGRPDSPTMTLSLSGSPGETKVSVLLQLPGLEGRSLVDARVTGIAVDAVQAELGRAVATADDDGYAEVRLEVTDSGQFRDLMVKAETAGPTCRVTVPLEGYIDPNLKLTCGNG